MGLINLLLFGVLNTVAILCLLRFVFQVAQVNTSNPLALSVKRFTDTILSAPRAVLPRGRYVDTASIFVSWLMLSILYGYFERDSATMIEKVIDSAWIGLTECIRYAIWIFGVSMVVTVILSWVSPNAASPYAQLAHQISQPILRPIQRFLPPLGGLDLSPALALFILVTFNTRLLPEIKGLVL